MNSEQAKVDFLRNFFVNTSLIVLVEQEKLFRIYGLNERAVAFVIPTKEESSLTAEKVASPEDSSFVGMTKTLRQQNLKQIRNYDSLIFSIR